jgi:hypothetical protein
VDEQKVLTPWYRQPIWLGLLGLALTLGGAMLSTYTPLTAHQAEQARKLDELRDLAGAEHADRLDQFARNVQPQPPYRLPGRVMFFAGVCLFVLAAVLMFRKPPVAEPAAATGEEAPPTAEV